MDQSRVDINDTGGQSVNIKRYTINPLDYESLPLGYTTTVVRPETLDQIQGLPEGHIQSETGYHPLKTCYLLLGLLHSYVSTKNPAYLQKAVWISDMFLRTGVDCDGSLYFPYTSEFHLHGYESEVMRAPWYSGMTQGMALATYVRFYQATGDCRYLDTSRSVFRTFVRLKNDQAAPWIAYVDSEGYYWIEEYPIDPPANTLNGFIVGIFGLYEWYSLGQEDQAKDLLQASITTIEHYLPRFRRKGDISLYCLKHRVQSAHYHRKHIGQLADLHRVTGDPYFLEMASAFRRDTIAVVKHFRRGWRSALLTLLPPTMAQRVYSSYDRARGIKTWLSPTPAICRREDNH